MVVDDADHDRLAAPRLRRSERSPCAQWPGRSNLRQLEAVDVQQRAGLRPLVAACRLALRASAALRAAVAAQDPPDRRAVAAAEELQAHPPPVRALARASRILLLARRRAARGTSPAPAAWARTRPPEPGRPPRPPANDPGRRHRRRRAAHRAGDRPRLLAGEKARNHLALCTRSEPAPTVCHVRSPSEGLSSQTAPSAGGRTSPQPSTKCASSSSRALVRRWRASWVAGARGWC